ncbi:unnamed protein product [Diamesa hyperborea]
MNSVLLLMILCGGFHSSHGESLKCQFKDVVHNFIGNMYTCYVRSLDNSYNNVLIDGYTGTHVGYRNDNDVKAIWIHEANTKYIPSNLGYLSNFIALSIESSQLVEIKAENFLGMQNLIYLGLHGNKLKSVPSDAFLTLKKLKVLYLWNNQIEYIGSGVFNEQTDLNYLFLKGNVCANKDYSGATATIQMKSDTKLTCDKANDVIQYEIIKELKETQQGHNMINDRTEINNLRTQLSLAKDEQKKEQEEKDQLMKELTDQKKELTEAKETIEQKLPKMEQTINELNMELMEIKSQRQQERTTYRELRTKLKKANEQLVRCEIDERSLI